MRIPCILNWPVGQRAPIGRTSSMFNLVDAMPTFLAGIPIPAGVQGISQLPLLQGETGNLRDWALVDFLASVRFHQQVLVHDGYKLVVYRDQPYGELYNLDEDPDQYHNLFDAEEESAIKMRMLHKLAQVNMETAGIMPRRISHA